MGSGPSHGPLAGPGGSSRAAHARCAPPPPHFPPRARTRHPKHTAPAQPTCAAPACARRPEPRLKPPSPARPPLPVGVPTSGGEAAGGGAARCGALAGTCDPRPGPAGSGAASPEPRAPWLALGPPLGRARTRPHPAVRVGGASRGRAPPSPRWRRCPGRPRPPARWPCGPRPRPRRHSRRPSSPLAALFSRRRPRAPTGGSVGPSAAASGRRRATTRRGCGRRAPRQAARGARAAGEAAGLAAARAAARVSCVPIHVSRVPGRAVYSYHVEFFHGSFGPLGRVITACAHIRLYAASSRPHVSSRPARPPRVEVASPAPRARQRSRLPSTVTSWQCAGACVSTPRC